VLLEESHIDMLSGYLRWLTGFRKAVFPRVVKGSGRFLSCAESADFYFESGHILDNFTS